MPSDQWMQTWNGERFDFNDQTAASVSIIDISTALARIPRWGGHTNTVWSVADHCLIGADLFATDRLKLLFLLHDAHEAYTGDIISPLKAYFQSITPGIVDDLQDSIQGTIYIGLNVDHPSFKELRLLKWADLEVLNYERQMLMLNTEHDWGWPVRPPHPNLQRKMKFRGEAETCNLYQRRFAELYHPGSKPCVHDDYGPLSSS